MARRLVRMALWLAAPLYLLFLLALYLAFLYAPTERVMGHVQRIFYFHVGAAWNALYLCFVVVAIAAVAYLRTRKRIWDRVCASFVEVGLTFSLITLLSGMIWAGHPKAWNTWWPMGDPRFTSVLVLVLIYGSFVIFRANLADGEKRRKYCAVLAIIGFLDVPIVHVSTRVLATLHPVLITANEMRMESKMIVAMFVAMGGFTLLLAVFICLRLSMRLQAGVVHELRQGAA